MLDFKRAPAQRARYPTRVAAELPIRSETDMRILRNLIITSALSVAAFVLSAAGTNCQAAFNTCVSACNGNQSCISCCNFRLQCCSSHEGIPCIACE
jgi:hypothetical protein